MLNKYTKIGVLIILSIMALFSKLTFPQEHLMENEKLMESTSLEIQVVDSETGQPIIGSLVLIRSEATEFNQTATTGSQGTVRVSSVPIGRTLIQVTKDMYEPGGVYYDLNQEKQYIQLQLEKSPEVSNLPSESP